MSLLVELFRNAVLSAIPAVGFGMAFNVPARVLGWIVVAMGDERAMWRALIDTRNKKLGAAPAAAPAMARAEDEQAKGEPPA